MKASSLPRKAAPAAQPVSFDAAHLVHRHLRLGWGTLLVFLTLGLVLEGLHAFKVGPYLDPSQTTRRLMWTLAHAHGTLLGLVNLGFAFSMSRPSPPRPSRMPLASHLLQGATVLLPAGFFLGGISFHGGDPGMGIVLVPLGAFSLLVSVWLTMGAIWNRQETG